MNVNLVEEGTLKYKDGYLIYKTKEYSNKLPLLNIKEICLYNNIELDSKTLSKLLNNNIIVNIFNKRENYVGVCHNQSINNGKYLIKQVEAYNSDKRLVIAKQILISAFINMSKVLKKYDINISDTPLRSSYLIEHIVNKITSIEKLMLFEAKIRHLYYSYFNMIINYEAFYFQSRKYHPANDKINCLISFINSIIYKHCLGVIYKVKLNPSISYLHSSNDRTSSLQYDISEIYKPIIGDRVLFSIINRNQVSNDDFIVKDGSIIISYHLKKIIINEINMRLNSSILINKRKYTYKQLIERDCYSLRKYINDETDKINFFRSTW